MSGEEVVPVAETSATSKGLGEPMDIMSALQLVLQKSMAQGELVRGIHEGGKLIEKHAALLCISAEDCNMLTDYIKLVKALCVDHIVSLILFQVPRPLASGLSCKIDSEGKARKVVGCSCVVVKDYGDETEGLYVVQPYVESH